MAKLFLTPLLTALLVLGLALILLSGRAASLDRRGRLAVHLAWATFLWLVLTGSPACSHLLEAQLSARYCGPTRDVVPVTDTAVVLDGGAIRSDPGTPAELNTEAVRRVRKGVAIFLAGRTGRLVMAGQSDAEMGKRNVDLMRTLAMASGVQSDRIDLEPNAMNTRQHPVALLEVAGMQPTMKLAVVTSGWHLRRAMGQFQKRFPNAISVAATCPAPMGGTLDEWLPSASGLGWTAVMSQEYVGRLWYAVQDVFGG